MLQTEVGIGSSLKISFFSKRAKECKLHTSGEHMVDPHLRTRASGQQGVPRGRIFHMAEPAFDFAIVTDHF